MNTLSPFAKTLFAASIAALSLVSEAQAAPPHVAWAETLIANLSPDQNEYNTNPNYIYWAGIDGASVYANRTQCSSFLTRILKRAYGWTDTEFKNWFHTANPNAATYYDAIVVQNRFNPVVQALDIQSGDIIAVKYLFDAATTGHVMTARGPAVLKTPVLPYKTGTAQYEIEVIDSAKSGHGSLDTRMMPDGSWDTGAGIGKARLYVDTASGTVVGYSWSFSKSSEYHSADDGYLIAAGRVIP